MSVFLLACAALVALSVVALFLPWRTFRNDNQDLAEANVDWYRLREQELTLEGNEGLKDDARLRLLEDELAERNEVTAATRTFPVWVLLPLIVAGSAALYYRLGAAPDVLIVQQLNELDASASEQELQQLIESIEQRSGQRPDNLHYQSLLGRYYMGEEDYAQAASIYTTLVAAAPGDAQALAYAAQAAYLAGGRQLTAQARLWAEQSLAANPHQRTALGLLGMASFEQQQYRAAIDYWERLVAVEAPGSQSAQMIQGVIASAREKLGESAPPQDTTQIAGLGITVSVEVPAGANISPTDTVFVLARNASSSSRMPIAVQRLTAAQLPLTLRLDDSNSMAGQKISSIPSVIVAVQVSPDGRPGESSATWLGQAGPLAPSAATEPVSVALQARQN